MINPNSTFTNGTADTDTEESRSAVEVCVQVAVLGIIAIGSVVGNAMVIAVVVFNHKLHKPTYYFINSLAVADFLVGAIYIPFYMTAVLAREWQFSLAWCRWHTAFTSLSLNASLMTLCLVSLDRFLAITNPFRYQTLLTTFRSVVFLIVGWIHSTVWAVAPVIGWGEVKYDSKTFTCRPNWGARGLGSKLYSLGLALMPFGIPVIIMVYCYCRIYFVARYHVKHIQKNSVSEHSGTSGQRGQETKATKTLLLVLGAFVLAWLPYTVYTTAKMLSNGSWDISSTGVHAVITITMFNGCINPMIYATRDQRFRKGMKKLLCPCAAQDASEFTSFRSTQTRVGQASHKEHVEMGNTNYASDTQG